VSAANVLVGMVSSHESVRGLTPKSVLHEMSLEPIPLVVAKKIIVQNHYLHSLPGGTMLCFGVLLHGKLLGALALGAGSFSAHSLVAGAKRDDCISLTRLWLSDELPHNAESRVIGIVLRSLRRSTTLKFVVAYSDPTAGHIGYVYQASNWLYTGLSSAAPMYNFGDGIVRHSRSVGQIYGSHSIRRFALSGVNVELVMPPAKHRYVIFLDPDWRSRLAVLVLPYPKKEVASSGNN